MKTYVQSLILLRMSNVQTKFVEKIKHFQTFYVRCFFFQKSCHLWDSV